FVLMGDWLRTVEPQASDRATSGPEGSVVIRPARMVRDPALRQVEGHHRVLKSTDADADVHQAERAGGPTRAGRQDMGMRPLPLPDAHRAAALNIAYQKELARWKEELARWRSLPFWRRWRVTKPRAPEAPRGI